MDTALDSLSHPNFASPEDYGLARTYPFQLSWLRTTRLTQPETQRAKPSIFTSKTPQKTQLSARGSWRLTRTTTAFKWQSLDIRAAIQARPAILFLHRRTPHRAMAHLVPVYAALSARLDANVLAVDYRRFEDSKGPAPSVSGVTADARSVFDYLLAQGAEAADVLIVEHSLRTCVARLLAAELGLEGIKPRGLVLLAGFESVKSNLCSLT